MQTNILSPIVIPYNRLSIALYAVGFMFFAILFGYILLNTPDDRALWVTILLAVLDALCAWMGIGYTLLLFRSFAKNEACIIDNEGIDFHTFPRVVFSKLYWKDVESVIIQDFRGNIIEQLLIYFDLPTQSPYVENLNFFQKMMRTVLKNKPIRATLNAKQLAIKRDDLFNELKKYKDLTSAAII